MLCSAHELDTRGKMSAVDSITVAASEVKTPATNAGMRTGGQRNTHTHTHRERETDISARGVFAHAGVVQAAG